MLTSNASTATPPEASSSGAPTEPPPPGFVTGGQEKAEASTEATALTASATTHVFNLLIIEISLGQ